MRRRAVFTDAQFAARESETTTSNRRASALRTFVYRNQLTPFWRHVRLGNGESTREGWRCHFDVNTTRGVVVIGHCGRHLDLS